MISVICVYNKKEIYESCILESLKKQNYNDFELISIDNSENCFKNANEAINYAIELSKFEYILIVHQDVIFDENFLDEFCDYIKKIKDFGVLGVAGINDKTKNVISNIYDGIPKKKVSKDKINEPIECITVDECLFCFKKSNKYFPINNNTWHLYAVELSMKQELEKRKNYILPLELYHKSNARSYDSSYFIYLVKLLSKNKIVYTTCGIWKRNFSTFWLIIKNIIKFNLLKMINNIRNYNKFVF